MHLPILSLDSCTLVLNVAIHVSFMTETSSGAPLKLLFVGHVGHQYDVLFSKVSKLVAKKGPFDALFAFADPGSGDSAAAGVRTALEPYVTGEKSVPVPTYVVGRMPEGMGAEAAVALSAPEADAQGQPRVRFLGAGSASNLVTIRGLKLAFLDGRYNASAYGESSKESSVSPAMYYTKAAVDALKAELMNMEGDLDILLTSEWPAGVDKKTNNPISSRPIAEVALVARPRYHISGPAVGAVYHQRLPYVNEDKGAGKHATRFIGLAPVANAEKQQWMQALALVPCTFMSEDQFRSIPADATACPYATQDNKRLGFHLEQDKTAKRSKHMAAPSEGRRDIVKDKSKTVFVRNVPFAAEEEEIVAYFEAAVGTAGTVDDIVRKQNPQSGKLNTWCHIQFSTKNAMERACQLNEQDLMGRKLFIEPAMSRRRDAAPVEGCWFCLSNPNADIQLVASVGEESYVVLDKGPINDTHVLVLPIEHHACSIDLPPSTLHEIARYTSALSSYFASTGKLMVGFERFMRLKKSGGNHLHINILGVDPKDLPIQEDGQVGDRTSETSAVRKAFEDAGRKLGHGFILVPFSSDVEAMRENLRDVVGDGEYFSAILPDGSRLVHPLSYGERHPLSFGREVLATIAGVPQRADWKVCKMDGQTEEEAACAAFKTEFKRFDVNMIDN